MKYYLEVVKYYLNTHKARISAIFAVVFGALSMVFEGLGADSLFCYNSLVTTGVYFFFYGLTTALFLTFASVLLKQRHSKRRSIVIICVYAALILVSFLLLAGYFIDVWHAVVNCILVLSLLIYSLAVSLTRVTAWVYIAASVLILPTLAVCSGCLEPIALAIRNKNTALVEYGYGETIFPYAAQPEKLIVYKHDGLSIDGETILNSIQGYLAANGTTQVLYDSSEYSATFVYSNTTTRMMLGYIEKYYPEVQIEYIYDQTEFFDTVMPLIGGYVRYNAEDVHSTAVAYTMSGILNGIIMDDKLVEYFSGYNLTEYFDACDKDEKWLLSSKYMEKVNKNFIFYQRCINPGQSSILSYVNLTQGLVVSETDDIRVFKAYLKHMNRNAFMFGKAGDLSEAGVVTATARYSITFIYETSALNFAGLSGFRLENATKPDSAEKGITLDRSKRDISGDGSGKHSLCIMLSDGDNVRVSTEVNFNCEWIKYGGDDEDVIAYYRNDKMDSSRRGENFGINFGISGAMVEIAPIFALAYRENLLENEDMVFQISSLGYTYPSKWIDSAAWQQVMNRVDYLLDYTDTSVIEIMDYTEFMGVSATPFEFGYMKPYFDMYTSFDSVDGCLYINFMDLYAGYKGEICWSNGKPIVSAKYSIWNNLETMLYTEENNPKHIAELINAASTDVTSEDAYTFVIVHIWSGLDTEGNFKKNGNTFEMINQLVENLDDDVELLTATEFIARMTKNVTDKR